MKKLIFLLCFLSGALTLSAQGQSEYIERKLNEARLLNEKRNQMQAAAEQGDAEAQYLLGNELGKNYNTFRGIDPERAEKYAKESFFWHGKAAMQGHPEAQERLGYCYYREFGVSFDYSVPSIDMAAEWYLESARNGSKAGHEALQELLVTFPEVFPRSLAGSEYSVNSLYLQFTDQRNFILTTVDMETIDGGSYTFDAGMQRGVLYHNGMGEVPFAIARKTLYLIYPDLGEYTLSLVE
jgi:TPR repeat protein